MLHVSKLDRNQAGITPQLFLASNKIDKLTKRTYWFILHRQPQRHRPRGHPPQPPWQLDLNSAWLAWLVEAGCTSWRGLKIRLSGMRKLLHMANQVTHTQLVRTWSWIRTVAIEVLRMHFMQGHCTVFGLRSWRAMAKATACFRQKSHPEQIFTDSRNWGSNG